MARRPSQAALARVRRHHPLRSPRWRYDRVLEILEGSGRCTPGDDELIRGFKHFKARWDRGTERHRRNLVAKEPGLYHAWQSHERRRKGPGSAVPHRIEARILAGQADDEIAAELPCPPEAVGWYEAIFYHVRDRLEAHDWILAHVLGPDTPEWGGGDSVGGEEPLADPGFDPTLKWFAYFGGPHVLDFLLSGYDKTERVGSREDVSRWADGATDSQVRRRAAMAVARAEVEPGNALDWMRLHRRLREREVKRSGVEPSRGETERNVEAVLAEFELAARSDARAADGDRLRSGAS